ncbi:MAG TPA: hypothetical protein DC009_06495 [Porphyromonadaceae bacterium]|nr:hypothetical protein [Porphyromonadaceae bacterium]
MGEKIAQVLNNTIFQPFCSAKKPEHPDWDAPAFVQSMISVGYLTRTLSVWSMPPAYAILKRQQCQYMEG